MNFLNGKRTYIIAVLLVLANAAYSLGYVDADLIVKIDAILAPLGLAFLRAGIPSK